MRVGCARTVITPPLGTSLAGFGARQGGACGIHDDLYARALVLEDAGQRVALVVCDLCEIDAAFVAEVRRRVQETAAVSQTSVMVAATHSHAAPATFALYSPPPDPAWLKELPGQVAGAVAAASARLAPAMLAVGFGREASVGRNRRRPDGPVDPTVSVLRAERVDASPALLVHYACHPTVLGPDNLLISRDYTGFTVDTVERATGGWAMFVNGACGDVNVGHSADRSALGLPILGRTFERAEELGLRLAGEAVRALTDARPVAGWHSPGHVKLAAGQRSLVVPLRSTPPLEQVHTQVRACRRHLETLRAAGADDDAITAARLELLYAELALSWVEQRARAAGAGAAEETAEVQAFAVGDVALIGLPGEFFVESGLCLQNRSPFKHTVVIGYANGGIGYVPPASAFAEGGYETRLAPWSKVAPEAEGLILAAAAGLLDGLRDQQDERPG